MLFGTACADVYDVILPKYSPPAGCTCRPWNNVNPKNATEQARINSYWADGKAPATAGSSCAMPAV